MIHGPKISSRIIGRKFRNIHKLSKSSHPCLSRSFESTFEPLQVEKDVYEWWEKNCIFNETIEQGDRVFSMVIPPPNITGQLHIGHALTITIEDTIARWRKMMGDKVIWIPGFDHAGIATQTIVERHLMKESKITRHDIGREKFIEHVWKWHSLYSSRIENQLRRLGSSLDWTQKVFTMDEDRSTAVTTAFVELYNKGLIYRSTRLVNWCPTLQTVISDLEVEHVDIAPLARRSVPGVEKPVELGAMYSFAYPVEDGGELVVSTTRLETMLGDTAIAIHPDDPRYKEFHGKYAIHPFTNRKIPIILDPLLVDMTLGTGAVKVTPAHDPNDFACGVRHNLEMISIMDESGKLNHLCGNKWSGMQRFEAREKMMIALEEKGLFRGKEGHAMRLGLCSRSGDIIEPVLMPQWFVKCDGMAEHALKLVRSGELRISPAYHDKTWSHFLENIQDWCISRQLWWGHRVPAYKCENATDDEWIVAMTEEEAAQKASQRYRIPVDQVRLVQDPDVLDTWFSSGLFPMSALGWPNKDAHLLKHAYPLSLMETGSDILFFWVSRMTFLCSELSGISPFKDVFLHPMIRDKQGRKMSKSLGNVIDPIHVIEGRSLEDLEKYILDGNLPQKEVRLATKNLKAEFPSGIETCGTDALRIALASYMHQGQAINMDVNRVVFWRQFCNKYWNATRFVLHQNAEAFSPPDQVHLLESKWILSRLAHCVDSCHNAMENRDFAHMTQSLYDFFVTEFCDVYIELSKQNLQNSNARQEALSVLFVCLEHFCRLLHPVAPFVTEELWHRVTSHSTNHDPSTALVTLPYPTVGGVVISDTACEHDMGLIIDAVHAIRAMRQQLVGIIDNQHLHDTAFVQITSDTFRAVVEENLEKIQNLTRMKHLVILEGDQSEKLAKISYLSFAIRPEATVGLLLNVNHGDVTRIHNEIARLENKREKLSTQCNKILSKTTSPNYKVKAPAEVQEKDAEAIRGYEAELSSLAESIATLNKLIQ